MSAMLFSTSLAFFLLVVFTSATKLTAEEIVEDQEAVESKRVRQTQFLLLVTSIFTIPFSSPSIVKKISCQLCKLSNFSQFAKK